MPSRISTSIIWCSIYTTGDKDHLVYIDLIWCTRTQNVLRCILKSLPNNSQAISTRYCPRTLAGGSGCMRDWRMGYLDFQTWLAITLSIMIKSHSDEKLPRSSARRSAPFSPQRRADEYVFWILFSFHGKRSSWKTTYCSQIIGTQGEIHNLKILSPVHIESGIQNTTLSAGLHCACSQRMPRRLDCETWKKHS